ncbi:peptide/nickel transport system ATP-binding protein [Hoeflea marina]|uniref:Peptide/nickel transport system ATP-binding protein n=1 Tax=Hoeflea marina TaxID=274592 RepID=A0A317PKV7_9HYPH|nr:ABC transporter ATP-binding protein [Hoeflea marina]PWW00305.1 peptide/nickel transport system ATP-binding protein [Hoeflea marina]
MIHPGNPRVEPVLDVSNLTTSFRIGGEWHAAVRGISFALQPNETLALVGESGCGKSMTALSILGLVPKTNGRVEADHIRYEGKDLSRLPDEEMRKIRGNGISMIFQEPMTSLNPVLPVGFQVMEALRYHQKMSRGDGEKRALELLELVKIPSAKSRFKEYPHQFSGGMRQRVMIAMALACRPKVILADEPTTALDVTIQAQILSLLNELKAETDMSMIFITHNLGVVAALADRVAVMYAGDIVEIASVNDLFARPTHPYTEALLRSVPRSDRDTKTLYSIPGAVPPLTRMPEGCRFAARCELAIDICRRQNPPLETLPAGGAHSVRCWVRGDHDLTAMKEHADV